METTSSCPEGRIHTLGGGGGLNAWKRVSEVQMHVYLHLLDISCAKLLINACISDILVELIAVSFISRLTSV